MLRFQVEGTKNGSGGHVPPHLSAFLTPLLLENLIVVDARSLMECNQMLIGGEVPARLRIRVRWPAIFRKESYSAVAQRAITSCFHWAEHGDALPYDVAADDEEGEASSGGSDENPNEINSSLSSVSFANTPLPKTPPPFKNTTSYPYQLQAMSFMRARESYEGEEDNDASKILVDFLNEAESSSYGRDSRPVTPTTTRSSLPTNALASCCAGPVLVGWEVLESIRKNAPNGLEEPSPLWDRRFLIEKIDDSGTSVHPTDVAAFGAVIPFFVNRMTGEVREKGVERPKWCRGGILADEMGLGKTIEMLGCMLMGRGSENRSENKTLILTPLSLLDQWIGEIKSRTDLSVHRYYGSERSSTDGEGGWKSADVIVSSYGVAQSDFSRLGDDSPLFSTSFLRVVFDEAHQICNQTAKQTKAAVAVKAVCRWALTGTPISNKLDDLYGLLKIINCEPWNTPRMWKNYVVRNDSSLGENVSRCNRLLRNLMIRRTMKSTDPKTGKPLITLPPLITTIVPVRFTPVEREFYEGLFERCASTFSQLVNAGVGNTNMIMFLSLLMKLRQTCAHVKLACEGGGLESGIEGAVDVVESNHALPESFMKELLKKFNSPNSTAAHESALMLSGATQSEDKECSICLDEIELRDLVVTPCAHSFHRGCIADLRLCPDCREPISVKSLLSAARNVGGGGGGGGGAKSDSSKLNAILFELGQVWKEDKNEKILIFSQFVGFLDLLQGQIGRMNVPSYRIDGSKSLDSRQKSVDAFSQSSSRAVMIISMKAGGVGLNLMAASTVFICDPWWNGAIEDQCVGRAHRIGQKKSVRVLKFLVQDSVEVGINTIQQNKRMLSKDVLNNVDVEGAGEKEDEDGSAGKLTLDDFKLLFSSIRQKKE